MPFHEYLSFAFAKDPDLPEKIYHYSGLRWVTRGMIREWSEGLVVPAEEVQDRIVGFIKVWSDVKLLHPVDGV